MLEETLTSEHIKYEIERRRYNKIDFIFQESGSLRKELYIKHMETLEATASYRQVCMMAANRVGKSELGAYIIACHLMGEYPNWWTGKKFNRPVNILVCGETGALVRDSIQEKLMGAVNDIGSGLVRKSSIISSRPRSGIPNAIDTALIAYKDGGQSILQFQSYDQGREKFQATARDVIWDDEEPPLEVYIEQLLRTMTTNGFVLSTFTPLKGVSNTVMYIRHQAENDNAKVITATWDDAPHLTEEQKTELFNALPPHQRDARSRGIPSLGAGAIYPVPEHLFVIDPIQLPDHYYFAYGFDVGWNNTAACWGALDRDTDVLYIYADYKRGREEPAIHAASIKAKGAWIPGTIDPAAFGSGQKDGEKLIDLYRQQGLNVTEADNGVESGIFDVYERLCTGRIKVFRTCTGLLEEFRLYRRDEKGKIIKENDHIMDSMRYLVKTGISISKQRKTRKPSFSLGNHQGGWMSA